MSTEFIRSEPMYRFERFNSVLRSGGHSTYVGASEGEVSFARASAGLTARMAFSPDVARAIAAELLAAADAAERPDEQEAV
jgi:hypothetical protein